MTTYGRSSWNFMPREVLVRIFSYYIKTEGQKRLLDIISRVSSEWKNACFDCHLWRNFDGTLPRSYLIMLSRQGSFCLTEKIILSGEEKATKEEQFDEIDETEKQIKEDEEEINRSRENEKFIDVFSNMPNLKHVNFFQFRTLDEEILQHLLHSCRQLSEIEFSDGKKDFSVNTKVIREKLSHILHICGTNLTSIKFYSIYASNLSRMLVQICHSCPNLLEIHVLQSHCGIPTYFPLYCFQVECKKLKALSFDSYVCVSNDEKNNYGFPNLEAFTYVYVDHISRDGILDEELDRILHISKKLKFLDLRRSPRVTDACLDSLPAEGIEHLNVSYTQICHSKKFYKILGRWCNTLKFVDVSSNWVLNTYCIDKEILSLTACVEKSNLETLNLRGIGVSPTTIKELIEYCSNLQILSLESCKKFSECLQQVYHSKTEIKHFYKKLCDK